MNKRVLIITDNNSDRHLISRILATNGYKDISFAQNGKQGMAMVSINNADVVVVDANLADMRGFEVCRQIKAMKKFKGKIILITGIIDDAARESQADAFIAKSNNYNSLIDVII